MGMWNLYKEEVNKYLDSQCALDLRKVVEKIPNYERLLFIGNGGSWCIAAHMAEDFSKVLGKPALCLSNPGMITCLANDNGYKNIYKDWLDIHYNRNDLVFAISSSGESPNIIRGAKFVGQNNLITLTGFKEGNSLSKRGCINIHVPVEHYGIVESVHGMFLHMVLDTLVEQQS